MQLIASCLPETASDREKTLWHLNLSGFCQFQLLSLLCFFRDSNSAVEPSSASSPTCSLLALIAPCCASSPPWLRLWSQLLSSFSVQHVYFRTRRAVRRVNGVSCLAGPAQQLRLLLFCEPLSECRTLVLPSSSAIDDTG